MNIDAADKMPNLAVKPDGIHRKLEKYILRKVGLLRQATTSAILRGVILTCGMASTMYRQRRPCLMHGPSCCTYMQAFDEPDHPYLPDEVLFRQKEQFSDGVGYDWVDGLKEYAAQVGRSCHRH
jgi:asparagine synthase (glutamine-hydrolysing)